MKEKYLKYAEIFKTLSDPTRLQIVNMICDCGCNKCAQNILDNLHITQPTLSYHMKMLEKVGLLNSTKEKNSKVYKLNDSMFQELQDFLVSLQEGKDLMTCPNCNQKK